MSIPFVNITSRYYRSECESSEALWSFFVAERNHRNLTVGQKNKGKIMPYFICLASSCLRKRLWTVEEEGCKDIVYKAAPVCLTNILYAHMGHLVSVVII